MDVRITENREVGDASEVRSQGDERNAISTDNEVKEDRLLGNGH